MMMWVAGRPGQGPPGESLCFGSGSLVLHWTRLSINGVLASIVLHFLLAAISVFPASAMYSYLVHVHTQVILSCERPRTITARTRGGRLGTRWVIQTICRAKSKLPLYMIYERNVVVELGVGGALPDVIYRVERESGTTLNRVIVNGHIQTYGRKPITTESKPRPSIGPFSSETRPTTHCSAGFFFFFSN